VNGTSALLHLVRTYLEYSRSGYFKSAFQFEFDKFKDAIESHNPMSAIDILIDPENTRLKVWRGRTERYDEETMKKDTQSAEPNLSKLKQNYELFEHIVERHIALLEQVIEYQNKVAGHNGINLKVRLRKHIEGWDFVDLTKDRIVYPRVATIQRLGYGWVDLVRSINAITLFGRGFGEIIRPAENASLCPEWKTLPKGKFYLAASAIDLTNVMEAFGNKWEKPLQLVHDLLWHSPEGSLHAQCPCHSKTLRLRRRQFDPVQVLLPAISRKILPIRAPSIMGDGTSFIFGHNVSIPYRWPNDGKDVDLEEGNPEEPSEISNTDGPGRDILECSDHVVPRNLATSSFRDHESAEEPMVLSPTAYPFQLSSRSAPAASTARSGMGGLQAPFPTNRLSGPIQSSVTDLSSSRGLRRTRGIKDGFRDYYNSSG